jgi:Protein of unknown function (DUF2785)
MRCNPMWQPMAKRCVRLAAAAAGMLILPMPAAVSFAQAADPAAAVAAAPGSSCPPPGQTVDSMRALKAGGWKVDDVELRQVMALEWLACLGSPDPELRDELAFEALSAWMRGGGMSIATVRTIAEHLLAQLKRPDAEGFVHPFSALVLAEVARVDRQKPIWTDAERGAMVDAAVAFERSVRDYRGFDERSGWRHAVAHGADWLMQLSLNPLLAKPQLDKILDAVASQVLANDGHFYIYGEGERLAAPVLYVAKRNLHTAADWQAWFSRIAASAAPPKGGSRATQAGLARQHNASVFLLPLYAALQESAAADIRQRMLPAVVAALQAIG